MIPHLFFTENGNSLIFQAARLHLQWPPLWVRQAAGVLVRQQDKAVRGQTEQTGRSGGSGISVPQQPVPAPVHRHRSWRAPAVPGSQRAAPPAAGRVLCALGKGAGIVLLVW